MTARVTNEDGVINDQADGSFYGTLVCDDDDIFNMYVRIQ